MPTPTICYCDTCNAPDPHCMHMVNLAVAVCPRCTPIQDATCSRILLAVPSDWPKTFYACALHRHDLLRGVNIAGYWPDNSHKLRDLLPLDVEVDMAISCSYCLASHAEVEAGALIAAEIDRLQRITPPKERT